MAGLSTSMKPVPSPIVASAAEVAAAAVSAAVVVVDAPAVAVVVADAGLAAAVPAVVDAASLAGKDEPQIFFGK